MSANNPIDPFSAKLEAEAIRRGRELGQSSWRTPTPLVSEQWKRFAKAQRVRLGLERRWEPAGEALREATEARDAEAAARARAIVRTVEEVRLLGGEVEDPFRAVHTSPAELEAMEPHRRIAKAFEAMRVLRGEPASVAGLADFLDQRIKAFASAQAAWLTASTRFEAIHAELRRARGLAAAVAVSSRGGKEICWVSYEDGVTGNRVVGIDVSNGQQVGSFYIPGAEGNAGGFPIYAVDPDDIWVAETFNPGNALFHYLRGPSGFFVDHTVNIDASSFASDESSNAAP